MCGIAGIIGSGTDRESLEQHLAAMRQSLDHRGPDDSGLWCAQDGSAGFAHTRLAVLDLSPAGHQPMVSADGTAVICFNGEIYNYRQLRAELEAEGIAFRTGTDTEVLLHLYQRHGREMISRLRGMFAFAIWDENTGRALLARDRFGIKPLYYAVKGGTLVFASELEALRRSGCVSGELDPVSLCGYFELGTVAEPRTLLRDAKCLEAGCTLIWEQGRVVVESYWRPAFSPRQQSREEAVGVTRAALLDSLSAHFVSDVPVGLFLSGGLDSTALLALAGELGVTGISTFSIGVDDAVMDETGLAARTARHFGSAHHEMRLDGAAAQAMLLEFIGHMDQPSVDGFNSYAVSSFARSHQMKVVLSGLGGDELFGGYPSFEQVPRIARMSRLLHVPPGLARASGRLLERMGRSPRIRRLGGGFQRAPDLANAWRAFRGVFSPAEASALTRFYTSGDRDCAEIETPASPGRDPRDEVSLLELTGYMRNQLLKDSDVMSMAHGLELRVPLVDHILFEQLAIIPADIRLQHGKRLLIEAVPELPEWVINQPKRGFRFPFEKWMSGEWAKEFEEVTRRVPGPNPSWYQRWCVFMLERWLERH